MNELDVVTNGLLADFSRAQGNLRVNLLERTSRINACVTGGGTTAACTAQVNLTLPQSAAFNAALTGSVPLTLLPSLGAISGTAGGIGAAGAGSAINGTVNTNLVNGNVVILHILLT